MTDGSSLSFVCSQSQRSMITRQVLTPAAASWSIAGLSSPPFQLWMFALTPSPSMVRIPFSGSAVIVASPAGPEPSSAPESRDAGSGEAYSEAGPSLYSLPAVQASGSASAIPASSLSGYGASAELPTRVSAKAGVLTTPSHPQNA